MLQLVSAAFFANSVRYEICKTKADFAPSGAMSRFKSDPGVRMLLLLLAHGSRGITITEASHVFLLEPILNPQIEAQAVNRVHRIGMISRPTDDFILINTFHLIHIFFAGQKLPTFVHKYIVEGTVEEKILKLSKNETALRSEQTGPKRMSENIDAMNLTFDDYKYLFCDQAK
jgi:E3 ubiquitin-protein ligase SHPRH